MISAMELRHRYRDFFVRHGHVAVPSSSLIPAGDPSLLFVNAGMVPFKDTFLGREERPYSRAVSAQRCLRVSGKHNDLEEVGPSPFHQTFFEMLGNFSFGDYFKQEAIHLAWRFLIEELELPLERLWFTVFAGNEDIPPDEEAARLWIAQGAPPERVLRFGEKDNLWVMGDTGPCGPCSEITAYIGDDLSAMGPHGVNSADRDYVEIWNLVFMQYDRATMEPLPRPSIDTGMGLERMSVVLQGVHATYDTDLFTPIIARTMDLAGGDVAHYRTHQAAYRAIADHTRACTFLIADGVLPGNEGRAYVLRRILRRAAYQGRTIGLTQPFLAQTADVVLEVMASAYPELLQRRPAIVEALTTEEERFGRTLSSGLTLLNRVLPGLPAGGVLPGQVAFTLHDTHGFPLDLTSKIAAEHGLSVDQAGFDAAMEQQRRRSRTAGREQEETEWDAWTRQNVPPTLFTGYTQLSGQGRVLTLLVAGEPVDVATAGQRVQVALDQTPFYAQGGGQVGDSGLLLGPQGALVRIMDTRRPMPTVIMHEGTVERGTIRRDETVEERVDADRRRAIASHHTATHLLHRALRTVLGEHAAQVGSLVAPDRLRFDITHPSPLAPEQLARVERLMNDWVRADTPITWEVTSYGDALDRGALALFGEKYGDRVRLVTIGCLPVVEETLSSRAVCSRELCGGTHVTRTGEVGYCRITAESSVAAGVRRVEARVGAAAEAWAAAQMDLLEELGTRLGVQPRDLSERVDRLLVQIKDLQAERDTVRSHAMNSDLDRLVAGAGRVNGVTYAVARVDAPDAVTLREIGGRLRERLSSGVVVLGAVLAGKPQVVVLVTQDLVARGHDARVLAKALAREIGGGGGGQAHLAQAGGEEAARLDDALSVVPAWLAGFRRT